MQSPRSFCWLLGIVLIVALVMVGSGLPPAADAQQVRTPPDDAKQVRVPPRPPFTTIIQPGGVIGERYGLDYKARGGSSGTAPGHTEDR